MVSNVGLEPTSTATSTLRVCQLRQLDMVGIAGFEPALPQGELCFTDRRG